MMLFKRVPFNSTNKLRLMREHFVPVSLSSSLKCLQLNGRTVNIVVIWRAISV